MSVVRFTEGTKHEVKGSRRRAHGTRKDDRIQETEFRIQETELIISLLPITTNDSEAKLGTRLRD